MIKCKLISFNQNKIRNRTAGLDNERGAGVTRVQIPLHLHRLHLQLDLRLPRHQIRAKSGLPSNLYLSLVF